MGRPSRCCNCLSLPGPQTPVVDTWKKRIGFIAFMLFFMVMACVIVIPPATGPATGTKPQTTLPDGRTLRIERVTLHGDHEWRNGPRWKQKIQASLPRGLRKLLGPEVKTFRSSMGNSNTVVWLSLELRKGVPSGNWGSFKIISEAGEEFRGHGWSGKGDIEGRKLITPSLPVFPARDKTFTLIGELDGTPFSITGENPGYGKAIPSFVPEPLPIVRKIGSFEFKLAAPELNIHSRGHYFTPKVVVTEGGISREGWFGIYHKLFDPLGNRESMVSTNEPVWGVSLTAYRTPSARWATNEFFEFDAEVPASGAMTMTGLSHSFGGAVIDDIMLMGSGAFVFTNGVLESSTPLASGMSDRWSSSSSGSGDRTMEITRNAPWLLLTTAGVATTDHLTVTCHDENGKEIRRNGSSSSNFGTFNARIYKFRAIPASGKLKFHVYFEKLIQIQTFIQTSDLTVKDRR
jgi:hypothetical protein